MECYPECFSKVHVLLECVCVFVYASVFVSGALRVRVRPRATRLHPPLIHNLYTGARCEFAVIFRHDLEAHQTLYPAANSGQSGRAPEMLSLLYRRH